VSAFPAIKLLWGSVDSVHVRARELSLSTGGAESLLWEAHDISTLDFSAASVDVGRLRLGPASLSKHGSQLEAEASASASEIAAALPGGVAVQLVGGGEGKVEVRVSGSLFGLGTSLNAVATASEGRLVVRPLGLLSALQLTLLNDPHVHVEGVDARVESSDPLTYRLSMRALLR
jgi:hypothetical protein